MRFWNQKDRAARPDAIHCREQFVGSRHTDQFALGPLKMLSRCGSVLATLSFPLAPQRVRGSSSRRESPSQVRARESSARRGRHANGRARRTTLFPVEPRPVAEARA